MSNPSVVSLQLTAGSSNGIALSQTPAAAGNLTINGALASSGVATLGTGTTTPARRVLISSTGSDATVVFTVSGTNASGAPITSTVTGVVSGTPVYTALDFLTVSNIAVSSGTAGAITVGTNGVASTPWILDNFLAPEFQLSVLGYIVSGSVTFTIEHCYTDPNAVIAGSSYNYTTEQFSMTPGGPVPPRVLQNPVTGAGGVSVTTEVQYVNWPIFAHRLTILSGTGLVEMTSIQSGIGSP